jgi:ketosteroid isomerase-like protein
MPRLPQGVLIAAVLAGVAACSAPQAQPPAALAVDTAAIAHEAHAAYVAAINSNDVDSLMAVLTDDVVFQAPNAPELVGKAALRPWAEGYVSAYTFRWEKTTLEFIIAGDWAIERYAYKSHDVPKAGGPAIDDVGKGINIYHHDADGRWRVARDAWSSDLPAPTS